MKKTNPKPRPISRRLSRSASLVLMLLILSGVLVVLYQASIPRSYALSPGSVSDTEIVLTRPVINRVKTQEKAERAASQVSDVYHRSEQIADSNLNDVLLALDGAASQREDLFRRYVEPILRERGVAKIGETTPGEKEAEKEDKEKKEDKDDKTLVEMSEYALADLDNAWRPTEPELQAESKLLSDKLAKTLKGSLDNDVLISMLQMQPSTFAAFREHTERLARFLTQEDLSTTNLNKLLDEQTDILLQSNPLYKEQYQLVGTVLRQLIRPNMVFDEEATRNAREDAYQAATAVPVMIEKGTRIVSRGDKITPDQYQILRDADLLDSGRLDWSTLMGSLCCILLVLLLSLVFLRKEKKIVMGSDKRSLSILVTLLLPFVITAYISEYSPLASPVYFAAILLTAYYGVRTALILTTGLTLLVFPMTFMNYHFLFCALFGVFVSALVTDGFTKRDKYAFVIFSTALAPAFASLALDLILKTSLSQTLLNMAIFAATGAMSAVASVGVMPLYEMFLDAVSPLRLIELSNPNQPLLKRMLLEAPGTSQHSMMVANLAEVAADSIGADSLLTRVGALYHDIGKLENPAYFTENQDGENPHDFLPPQESARIIFAHVTDGVRMARKNRLPEAFNAFIVEHHGDTLLASIYAKAVAQAEANGLPKPDPKEYSYPGNIPQSKETGIVMIADSVEAAMKSTGYRELDKAEELIRKIVKGKNDQDQLVESGLSYQEVEKVIQAFLKVYAGQFHERIKYPDAGSVSKA